MYDFRECKEMVKNVLRMVNERSDWKWSAKVNKAEIKLTNDYIKDWDSGDCDDYFSIKLYDFGENDRGEEEALIEGRDCLGQTFTYLIPGYDRLDDGAFETCVGEAIENANYYFQSRY